MSSNLIQAFFARAKASSYCWLMSSIFLLHLAYFGVFGYRSHIPFDASVYWWSSLDFFRNGHFSLLTFDNGLRGYLYPLLLVGPRLATEILGGKPIHMAILLGSATAAIAFGYVFPVVYQRVNPGSVLTVKRRAVFALLGFLFWRGYFNYTLSDFPALVALALCMLFVTRRKSATDYLLAGLFLAAAINIRSVYLIAAPGIALALVLPAKSACRTQMKPWLLFAVGLALVFTPQFLINAHTHHTRSFLVQNSVAELGITDLYLAQLEWGVQYQKYETALGGMYPDAKVLFLDPVGPSILASSHLAPNRIRTQQLASYAAYSKLVVNNFGPMLTIYARHLFNMLDVHHSTPYIRNIYAYNLPLAILNYSVWFAAALLVFYKKHELSLLKLSLLSALVLPCIVALPMAVECRFALPAQVLLYALVSFSWPAHWQWHRLPRAHRIQLIGAYGAFVLSCTVLSLQTYDTLEFGKALFWS